MYTILLYLLRDLAIFIENVDFFLRKSILLSQGLHTLYTIKSNFLSIINFTYL